MPILLYILGGGLIYWLISQNSQAYASSETPTTMTKYGTISTSCANAINRIPDATARDAVLQAVAQSTNVAALDALSASLRASGAVDAANCVKGRADGLRAVGMV